MTTLDLNARKQAAAEERQRRNLRARTFVFAIVEILALVGLGAHFIFGQEALAFGLMNVALLIIIGYNVSPFFKQTRN
ncbi:hypothetical protein EOL96_00675 [Candidatus Saccharibacteria bacterium]|nr:hypothetical protein [Candidatus Saccharibacteria bacterium]